MKHHKNARHTSHVSGYQSISPYYGLQVLSLCQNLYFAEGIRGNPQRIEACPVAQNNQQMPIIWLLEVHLA